MLQFKEHIDVDRPLRTMIKIKTRQLSQLDILALPPQRKAFEFSVATSIWDTT